MRLELVVDITNQSGEIVIAVILSFVFNIRQAVSEVWDKTAKLKHYDLFFLLEFSLGFYLNVQKAVRRKEKYCCFNISFTLIKIIKRNLARNRIIPF